jgi:uncharacterized coiled-coil DUF342 family protein
VQKKNELKVNLQEMNDRLEEHAKALQDKIKHTSVNSQTLMSFETKVKQMEVKVNTNDINTNVNNSFNKLTAELSAQFDILNKERLQSQTTQKTQMAELYRHYRTNNARTM